MKEERQQKILQILEENQFASVQDLSRELYISAPTVRRDLNEMQKLGIITRSHGGAIRHSFDMFGAPIQFRSGINAEEKLRLSNEAAKLLCDDTVIYIDESSTALHIIDHLPAHKNITVVTNSMSALMLLGKYRIPTYCLGGAYSLDTMSFSGNIAEETVSRFSIDTMFFSSSAINSQGWIVDYNAMSNSLRRQVLRQASKKVFLCDKTKFAKRGVHTLIPLTEADYIVINAALPPKMDTGDAVIMQI